MIESDLKFNFTYIYFTSMMSWQVQTGNDLDWTKGSVGMKALTCTGEIYIYIYIY